MTREIEIEKPATAYAKSRGWFEVKIEKTSKKGFPDRFYARNGKVILVEYKAPGEVPKGNQIIRHKELRAHGVVVFVIDKLEDVYAIFR